MHGNARAARHTMGLPWPHRLLSRFDLAEQPARPVPYTIISYPANVADGLHQAKKGSEKGDEC